MSLAQPQLERSSPTPLPAGFGGVQPGLGFGCRVELLWGVCRRAWLNVFRRGYVARMAQLRRGAEGRRPPGAPHDILDPRDLKYCRNLVDCWWEPQDDPFRGRERWPFARWGLAELQIFGWPLLAATLAPLIWSVGAWKWVAVVPGVLLALVLWFFRDPPRRVPQDADRLVSPADGKLVEITELAYDEFIGGPAVRLGIFLSIFNVHINRAPARCRVLELRYWPGEFLNALLPESAVRNENMWIGLEEDAPPFRRLVVRQISGAIARRIVCDLKPGETLDRGHKFGMIKFGSRTELLVPLVDGLRITANLGQKVVAGETILAQFPTATEYPPVAADNDDATQNTSRKSSS